MLNLGNKMTAKSMAAYAEAKEKYLANKTRLEELENNPWRRPDEEFELFQLKGYPFQEVLAEINRYTDDVINQAPDFFSRLSSYNFSSKQIEMIFKGGLK